MTNKIMNLMSERQRLLDEFNHLDERDEIVRKPRFSQHQETGELMLIGIIARKKPRWFYDGQTADKHRLLMVKLVKNLEINGTMEPISMEFPYSISDLEAMWESMFDVWVKPEKKAKYAERFKNLINKNLQQAQMELATERR